MDGPDPMAVSDPMGVPRCSAHSKQTGKPCRQPAILGGTVCHYHGGGAPQVKAKAGERLRALEHPAITRLGELVAQKEFPSVAIAAVKDVLDRVQGKATESLAVSHSGTIDYVSLLRRRHARHSPAETS